MSISKLKIPIIVLLVLVAGGAGLYVSGFIGGGKEGPTKKKAVEPVRLAEPFLVNLVDAEANAYLQFSLAVQIEPLTEEEYALWSGGGGGGHGGATEPPGPKAVASYPKFRDAVIEVSSKFTAEELLTASGKSKLKKQLLARFDEIAERDKAEYASGTEKGAVHDPSHPPYHVIDIYFQDFAVQP